MEDMLLSQIKIKKIKNSKLKEDFISDQCKYLLFLNDTIYDIKNKLAFNFNSEKNIIGDHIYMWIKDSKNKIFPLGFLYDNYDTFSLWDEKTYDMNFVYRDGKSKIDVSQKIDDTKTLEEILIDYNIDEYELCFSTVFDFMKNFDDSSISDEQYLNGILKKYFPYLTKLSDINKIKKEFKKSLIDKYKLENDIYHLIQKNHSKEVYNKIRYNWTPNDIIYKNIMKSPNHLNLIKLFKNIELTDNIPFSRFYLDSYKDTYFKLYKGSITDKKNKFLESKIKITKDIFERWTKGEYILNGLYKEKKHNLTNSVSFVLSHRGKFGILIFYVNGEINLIAQNKNKFFEKSDIEELIIESNQFIQLCNKDNFFRKIIYH